MSDDTNFIKDYAINGYHAEMTVAEAERWNRMQLTDADLDGIIIYPPDPSDDPGRPHITPRQAMATPGLWERLQAPAVPIDPSDWEEWYALNDRGRYAGNYSSWLHLSNESKIQFLPF